MYVCVRVWLNVVIRFIMSCVSLSRLCAYGNTPYSGIVAICSFRYIYMYIYIYKYSDLMRASLSVRIHVYARVHACAERNGRVLYGLRVKIDENPRCSRSLFWARFSFLPTVYCCVCMIHTVLVYVYVMICYCECLRACVCVCVCVWACVYDTHFFVIYVRRM